MDLPFAAAPGELLDGVPLPIAAEKVHAGIDAGRIAPQHLLHETDGFEGLAPVERGRETEARHHVRRGGLIGRLPLVFRAHGVLGGRVVRDEVLLDDRADRGEPQPVLPGAVEQLHDEGGMHDGRHRPGRLSHVGGHAQDEGVGRPPRLPRLQRLIDQSPEVLDERELEHARPRPELADRQRRHALIAVQKLRELLAIEAAVAVADDLHGDRVDTGFARVPPGGQPRQVAEKAGGQVRPDVGDFRCDEMKVVEQPLRRRADELAVAHVGGQHSVRSPEPLGVLDEPRKDISRAAAGVGIQRKAGGEPGCALLEALDAQERVAKRLLSRRPGPQPAQQASHTSGGNVRSMER